MGEFVVLKCTTLEESNQRHFQIFFKFFVMKLKRIERNYNTIQLVIFTNIYFWIWRCIVINFVSV